MHHGEPVEQTTKAVPADVASGSHVVPSRAAWGAPSHYISRWPASLAVLASIVLYLVLPDNLIFLKPRWTLPVLEALLLVPIVLTNASDRWRHASWKRPTFMVLVALASAANIISLALLVHYLPGAPAKEAKNLLVAAVEIWLTNVIVFGLWYWELDRGGPIARLGAE
ncbi:MAG: hypothetical protein DLM70_05005, partial [Chloroflexi bacterium]